MIMNRRLTIVGMIAVLAILITAGIIKIVVARPYTATINITVTPSVATITLNGQHASNGKNKVKPGNYTVTASYKGFTTVSKQVSAQKGQTATVGIILESNSPLTASWYQSHSKDQTTAEVIAGRDFDTKAAQQAKSQPIINLLPYIGPGFEYRIDYGLKPSDSSNPVIYIQTDSDQGKQDALDWIKNQGFNPSTLNIQYVDQAAGPSGPSGPAGGPNN
jgi:hypothetical protein